MTDIQILRKLVLVGAAECNVEESRAISLLERLTGTTKPSDNKDFFYNLCSILGQGPTTKYTTARANKLRIRLKKASRDDMIKAATAIAANGYMMGESGRKYGTIDYLIRSDELIDTWLQQAVATEQAKQKSAIPYKQPEAITQAAEVKRADPAAVAAAKAKLYEKMGRK